MAEEDFFKDKPQTSIIAQVVHRYLPFWPIFVILTVVSLAIAFVYLRSQTRIYVASAKVLLIDPQKGGDSKVLDALNIFTEKKIVENEIIVLRSANLMRPVVKQLDLYASTFNEGNVQIEELYAENSPVTFVAINKDSVYGAGKHYFDMDWKTETIKINGQRIKFGGILNMGGTDYRVDVNPRYNRKATGKKFYAIFNSVEGAVGGVIGSLRVSPQTAGSTVLDLKITTPVPAKGVDVLNKLFEIYNLAGIVDKNRIADTTLNFIDDRLNTVLNQLDSVERNIQDYKSRNNITNLGSQASSYFASIMSLDQQNNLLDLKTQSLGDLQSYINSKNAEPGTVPSLSLLGDNSLSPLLSQLYTEEKELIAARAKGNEQSDAVRLGEKSVAKLKKDIKENMSRIGNNLNIERASVNKELAEKTSMLSEIPEMERGLLNISREQAIKNSIYTYLLQKREETAISTVSTSGDLRVLEAGYSYGPISPIAKNFYLTGFIIGLLVFLLFVQIVEQFNNKILFRKEIEDKTNVPVISEIVQAKTKDPIAISEGKRTVIAEQFRSLRTNLAYMGFGAEGENCLLVTSSISGEGKSFIAINLAISITLTGKTVALMEMDLRKPKLSRELGVQRDPGMSSFLVNKASLDEIIKPTAFNGLSLVTAGPIPPNPTELIGKTRFAEMMAELKTRFDYVIIDTAPIGPVTDAQLLAEYADISLFVIRHKHTPNVFIRMIDALHREKKFKNMSIVFNGIKPRGVSLFNYGFGGYGNGYGYGYGFGYGYGYGYGSEGTGYYTSDPKEQPGFKNLFGFAGKIKKLFGKRR